MRFFVFLLKLVFEEVISPLTRSVNLSFKRGIFPVSNIGKVIPLDKKDDPLMPNYRPSTTPWSLSKVFEYAFFERLNAFLDEYTVLSEIQHGFEKKRSTTRAMLSLCNEMVPHIEAESPAATFWDFSRAFDCVSRDIL